MSTDTEPDTDTDPGTDTTPPPVVRARRPRTAVLLVGALLLGPLLGGGIGYAIQANRPPTPLPPLQLTVLPKYPSVTLDPKAAADAAPKPLAIDGDLRKLLLSKPADAQDWDDGYVSGDGWETVGELARSHGSAAEQFRYLLAQGLRRTAIATWQRGATKYRIQLMQYGPDSAAGAISGVWRSDSDASLTFANGMEGGYGAPTTPQEYTDTTEQYYYGVAEARRGGVLMMIELFSPAQVNADEVRDLAQAQWERLA
ncbi:hypothetical protein P3T36_004954 [Kitasatospora sp. MAP12-15]|uniref:hypothetical protein n=1 Tax=unclassified Kitasatospora TaxID=2633591 RepID=UPI002474231A|nr:hypothetical protein [Kitasatospora sp. MAP12-44]MDH6112069.1 hypothetical protein [Kitasatospora sp. MAP12-44]